RPDWRLGISHWHVLNGGCRRDRLDRGKLGRDDRRRLGFARLDPEQFGAREYAEGCRSYSGPAEQREREEPQRRPHWGSSAGKIWRGLSQRVAPPPKGGGTGRGAGGIAVKIPATRSG